MRGWGVFAVAPDLVDVTKPRRAPRPALSRCARTRGPRPASELCGSPDLSGNCLWRVPWIHEDALLRVDGPADRRVDAAERREIGDKEGACVGGQRTSRRIKAGPRIGPAPTGCAYPRTRKGRDVRPISDGNGRRRRGATRSWRDPGPPPSVGQRPASVANAVLIADVLEPDADVCASRKSRAAHAPRRSLEK